MNVADKAESPTAPRPRPTGHLFRKYALVFGLVVAVMLVASGLVQGYFAYQQTRDDLMQLQTEQAATAAARIEGYIGEVQRQLAAFAQLEVAPGQANLEARRNDYLRLLRLTPAISELSYMDAAGREQFLLSRVSRTIEDSQRDYSGDERFTKSKSSGSYIGPIDFIGGSEPYVTLAVADNNLNRGVIAAQVNLKFILDVIRTSQSQATNGGYAYVVDAGGQLIAHPFLGLVLKKSNYSSLPQVKQALEGGSKSAGLGLDPDGKEVLSAHRLIPSTGWLVFVDQPASEAFAPLNAFVLRTALLLALGVVLALVAALVVARRMVFPIRALQSSAAAIAGGALDQHIDVRTGDELEELASEFNLMAERLRESYAGLEEKVEQRTQALTAALDELAIKSRQLEISDRHKSQFVSNMSHELRTPLNAIIGFSEVLLAGGPGFLNEKQTEYQRDVLFAGKHLLALISDILDLSRVEAGQMDLDLSTWSMAEALESSLMMIRERAAAHAIEVSLEVDPDVDLITADERKVRQILFNLLVNAVKFTPDGGSVKVRSRLAGESLQVEIQDSGIGIASEDQALIFDEFQQVGDDSNARREGTGLGLAIAKKLVELHGGHIGVESIISQGSTFCFDLPLSGRGA